MTAIEPDDQDEKPLDPAMENVRRKMVRLQIVSGAIMFVSLMAVFGAVVYKTMREPKETASTAAASGVPSDAPLAATLSLPLGFKVQSTSFSAGQILFYGETVEGRNKALVFDLKTGRTVADVTVAGN
ncbi:MULTISPECIES: hypothetical protein [Rhizobium]|uniref:Fimbrial protein n=1 Tax=Rhizobium bangladeshense TaxID=1138189 RepID=A0ABS7LAJ9_9HYPH|nr:MULTISPECIES: hypothetical protein [Rhizobium]MBX4866353.1 hypothetical protein [Rhizobium bangladeshense]MBX4876469.1 hypothetical protein [Rhizobium bangladeshense]MBX4885542.1 hypothetical protein [Rhizobium bangladeshense]MBX4888090.1 hypothetical protein [Rhizobium bangladeshense]MBX4894000.1 hypothetical protein [Rhizobium bangladeshense]